ncbi:MAG: aspartate aminotransferase family protein [Candidatus Sumerlaeia bacterium]|nr:aspartate aminotransferase family protein [Candidatus Sumerlaeia bacterium]
MSADTAPAVAAPQLPPCDHTPRAYSGPTWEEALALRKRFLTPTHFHIYGEPMMLVEGHRQYVWDHEGRRYLDFYAGIVTASVGHSHPKVLAAVKDQLDLIQHVPTIYLHPAIGELGEAVAKRVPKEMGDVVTYFVNSGSEANDIALVASRVYTGNWTMLALRNAYHGAVGHTMGLTSPHVWKYNMPHQDGMIHVANPDPYRAIYPGTPEEIAACCVRDVEDVIKFSTSGDLAGIIIEPWTGVGGVTSGHPSYFKSVAEVVRRHGGLYISDEVQTAFGRTGEHYWGVQNFGVVPDIITTAKGLGCGTPIGAVVMKREIAQALATKIHFSTFGGNPVTCAQAKAVLEVMDEERMQENCHRLGGIFRKGLEELQRHHPIIGDIRGKGLMVGVELVKNRATKEPTKEGTGTVVEVVRDLGALIGRGGLYGNVLRLKPPMCVTEADVEFLLDCLDIAFGEAERRHGIAG